MSSLFETSLADTAAPVALDLELESRCLLVAFGGIAGALGMPPFEFFKIGSTVSCKKMFVRDLRQSWYHEGLPGVGRSMDSVCKYLQTQIDRSGASRVLFLGNSMGGYAALLFGALLGAQAIHAFSPQTFLGPLQRLWYRDRRWAAQIRRLHSVATRHSKYFDLRQVLARHPVRGTACVHYGLEDRLDRAHAERLRSIPNLTLRGHAGGGHDVIKRLRDSGELRLILMAALAGS